MAPTAVVRRSLQCVGRLSPHHRHAARGLQPSSRTPYSLLYRLPRVAHDLAGPGTAQAVARRTASRSFCAGFLRAALRCASHHPLSSSPQRYPVSSSSRSLANSSSAPPSSPAERVHPPFASSLPDSSLPPCDLPSLNPANPPPHPPPPSPLSVLHPSPIRHLLIYKKVTTLEEIRRGLKHPNDFPYLREDAKVLAADREHQHSISVVRESIALSGVQWREVEVIDPEDVAWADCIICVGGDGTFLKASRHIQENDGLPIVGVNSAPSSSFGFFSAADHHSFPTLLRRILDGSALLCPLWRARLCVNGTAVGHPVLNEILFCNPIPSATTRYLLTNRGVTQLQQSSGIWISTAAGSTGAILGAGGQLMHLSDYRFQYRVRELFSLPITHPRRLEATDFPHIHYNSASVQSSSPLLTHGFLDADFHFISRMMTGCLYLDGSILAIPVQFNDRVSVRRTERPLQWVCPTKEGEGKEQIDHWELVTGLRRARMPDDGHHADAEVKGKG